METIVVTGASRGLGLEFVRQYGMAGERVFALCRQPEKASGLQEIAELVGNRITVLPWDATDEASILAATAAVARQTEAVDLLINNAGIADMSRLEQASGESMIRLYRTNVVGAFLTARAFIPLLARGTQPRLINISSGLGSIGMRDPASSTNDYAYSASKAALNMVSRQLAFDLREKGIAVIAQCPGWVRTDMGGAEAPLAPAESIGMLRKLFTRYTLKESGKYFGHTGEEYPW